METHDNPPSSTDATSAFERALEALVLSAYGDGAAIEGDWHIDVPISAAPNWTITIEKRETEREPTYEPRFLTD